MEGFGSFLEKAKKLTDTMGKKANVAIGVSKLRINASQIQGDIKKAYEKLGEIVYKTSVSNTDAHKLIGACISEIDDMYRELEKVNSKIDNIKCLKKCRKCGYTISEDAAFCARCGADMREANDSKDKSDSIFIDEQTPAFKAPIESVINDINEDDEK